MSATADTVTEPGDNEVTVAVSVVLPCYDEAQGLKELFGEIQIALRDYAYEVVFVDDGSTDDTPALIDEFARDTRVARAVHLARNYGQSAALAAGFDEARGDVVVPMDADGQNDPSDIPRLIRELETKGLDCVSGWRKDRDDPLRKRAPSWVQTMLAKQLGPEVNDYGCTLKAYRSDAIQEVGLWGEGHRYIPLKLYDRGYSVGEIEVNHRARAHGDSKYGAGRVLRGFVDLLYHAYLVWFSRRPMHLFGGTGVVALGLGGAIGVVSVVQKYVFGVELGPRTPRLILTALLVIFGAQLLVFGVLAEKITRLTFRDEAHYRVREVIE